MQEPISPELFKKYVAYSRQNCHPLLTADAARVLRTVFVDTRKRTGPNGSVPITVRNLLSMTRLAYASARMRLSPTVDAQDAQCAANLVLSTLERVGLDTETGQLDSLLIETGRTQTSFDRTKAVTDIIRALSATNGGSAPVDMVSGSAFERGISAERLNDIVDRLKQRGEVYSPSQGRLKMA